MDNILLDGTRYAILHWVERTTVQGDVLYRIVFKIVNEAKLQARPAVLRPNQIYQNPRTGDYVRLEFAFNRIIRVTKAM